MRIKRFLIVAAVVVVVGLFQVSPALAHDAPDEGAEWLLADWMLLSFLVFFAAALATFLVAVKRGFFRNVEQAKYYLLTIDEPDYYTPEWVREEERFNAKR